LDNRLPNIPNGTRRKFSQSDEGGNQGLNLTGNPFVDAGFGIAASKAGRQSVEELSSADLQQSVLNLHANIETLKNLKILASFWVNNPFMGKNPGQRPKFERFLRGLETGRLPIQAGHCQVCGRPAVINSAAAGCQVDRSWFPLAASGDSDPCTLPGLRGKAVCSDCLAAVVVLPLGCRACPDGPYFVHVNEPDLQAQAVLEGIAAMGAAISANAGVGITHGTDLRGRVALLDIASGSVLWDHSQPGHMARIPRSGAAMISFSNRGTGACFSELNLPAQALNFFGAIAEAGDVAIGSPILTLGTDGWEALVRSPRAGVVRSARRRGCGHRAESEELPFRAAQPGELGVQGVDGLSGRLAWHRGGRHSFRRCGGQGAAGALVAAVGLAAAGTQLAHLLWGFIE
jgi:hypothetical protein